MATATKRTTRSKKSNISLVLSTFTGASEMKYNTIRSGDIKKYVPITDEDYILEYGTPLRDATARFIQELDALKKAGTVVIGCLADMSLSMRGNEESVINGLNEFVDGMKDTEVDPESDGKVIAVIFTDGLELHSKEVSPDQLSRMIADKEDEGWTFIYLGANQNAWDTAQGYGFRSQGTNSTFLNFDASKQGTASAMRNITSLASYSISSPEHYKESKERFSGGTINALGNVVSEGKEFNVEEEYKKQQEKKKK